MSNPHIGKTCPFCQAPLKPNDTVTVCPHCHIPHHQECWQQNGGCTTYGCQGRLTTAPPPVVQGAAPGYQGGTYRTVSSGPQIFTGNVPLAGAPITPQGFDAFGPWISEVFRLWAARWQVWVLQGLIIFLITVAVPASLGFVASIMGGTAKDTETILGIQMLSNVFSLIGSIGSTLLMPGMVLTALKQLRGQEIAVSDLFSGMRYFWGMLVNNLCIGLGVIACCVGAFATGGLLFMTMPIFMDRQLGLLESMKLSWRTAATNFWFFLLFAFVAGLLGGAGAFVCYIGLIATISWMPIAQAVAYERTFNTGGLMPTAGTMPSTVPGMVPPPYTPPAPPPTRTCAHCGIPLRDGQSVCPNCGTHVA